ncbi:cytochrome c3 family protein [Rhodoferax sp.]|uniref:cytochrome c3 family protein n=1 Tax=Rhodoferax sp. TaxID=50421 RepID=UPI00275B0296|nr:cytochrome c3 family protein [Rhodoferax sp.]
MMNRLRIPWLVLGAVLVMPLALAGPDRPTEFTNQGGITNTRHNMTQRSATGTDLLAGAPNSGGAGIMDSSRNNYGEVCVYCHTPHGANTNAAAPLWNRTLPTSTVYQTYNTLNTSSLTQTVSQPGAASLPCLSCHDGQQAVDAIINMPGSGRYKAVPDTAFLNTWPSPSGSHDGLNNVGCLACHNPSAPGFAVTAGDFTIFAIGTDLRNDHPVGVNYPTASGASTDWKAPSGSVTRGSVVTTFFDENSNSRMDKGDIRLYGTGSDSRVECASCHDPHGVPSGGAGSTFLPTFLRKTNTGSAVCLTCHNK